MFLPDMDRPVSATEGHFIRSHFAALKLSSTDWALPVTGEVDNPLKISYEGLLKMPSHEVISLMDCAGSSRSTMQPSAKGVQWDNGGLSVSRWKGVSVKTILEPASLKGSASNVLFVGADSGKEFHSDGTLVNEMNVPLEKLLHPDSILAYKMNGETLPGDQREWLRQNQASHKAQGQVFNQQPQQRGYRDDRNEQGDRRGLV